MQLQILQLSKSFVGRDVLIDVSFSIKDSERVAIVGKNGSGKSTLLKIIAGLEKHDNGVVSLSTGITIGYIPQAPENSNNQTVSELLQMGDIYEEHDISRALSTFELEDLIYRTISSLSSGQKTKVYLARLLLVQPDLLLLDEPTNHLDTDGLDWLENYLKYYPGSVLFVSHDRMFLDNVATKVLELDEGKITVYGGNYSFYKHEKEVKMLAEERQYVSQQKEIKRLTNELHLNKQRGKIANKIKKKSGTSRAEAGFFANRQSQIFGSIGKNIERQIDRIDKIEKPESIPELHALFKPKRESGESVLLLKNVEYFAGPAVRQPQIHPQRVTPALGLPDRTSPAIINSISLHIQRGDRIALVGQNGSGKTTLVKLILGELIPDTGDVKLGANVDIGYLSQEHTELKGEQSVTEELENKSKISTTDAYALLVRFLIPKEKIRQSVNTLSSGEKAKLLLAEIMTAGSNFLILDEPTNHLDIPSREALEEAIANYDGTLLVISHDRYFLERIGTTRRIEIKSGSLTDQT